MPPRITLIRPTTYFASDDGGLPSLVVLGAEVVTTLLGLEYLGKQQVGSQNLPLEQAGQ
jgi:hypothetical protein